jgi:hypothetical protein
MTLLPAGFEAMEPFVAGWAVVGSANRAGLRGSSPPEERLAFFDATSPLLQPALALLDAKALADHDEAEQRLMNLTLSFAHVSLAIEVQQEDETKHTPNRDAMVITRAPADF